MAFIYSLADTWADGATTFKGISLNVTDTASAAGSLLMDLQVGGGSQFNVNKSGIVRLASQANIGANASPAGFGSGPNTGLYFSTGNWLGLQVNNNAMWAWNGANPQFIQPSSGGLCWSSGAYPGFNALNVDLILTRDAANTLAQRNGVNAQAFNLYNTYTDASNYERIGIRWSGNDAIIGVQVAGTGTFRQLHHVGQTHRFFVGSSGTTFAWNIEQTGSLVAQTGVFVGLVEMTAPAAPAANGVRIYAEDNGAGKTRLMALFPTGVAQQIAIEP